MGVRATTVSVHENGEKSMNKAKNKISKFYCLAEGVECRGRDLNPRTPTRIGPEPITFGQAR